MKETRLRYRPDYIVVSSDSIEGLKQQIDELMDDRTYNPCGGIAVSRDRRSLKNEFHQALIGEASELFEI